MVLSIIFLEDKHKILLHLSIFYEYQQFFQHRICFSIQPQLQLVNLHRNRRYFVIKFHTWFCLSYFLKTNIKFYCIYQYFIWVSTVFSTPYLFLDTAARLQWPRVTHFSMFHQFFFLIMLLKYSLLAQLTPNIGSKATNKQKMNQTYTQTTIIIYK